MLEFMVGFVLGAETQRDAAPMTWRGAATAATLMFMFFIGLWALSGLLQPDVAANECNGTAVAVAICGAGSGALLKGLLVLIACLLGCISLLGFIGYLALRMLEIDGSEH